MDLPDSKHSNLLLLHQVVETSDMLSTQIPHSDMTQSWYNILSNQLVVMGPGSGLNRKLFVNQPFSEILKQIEPCAGKGHTIVDLN